jgi:hypothetical protein
MGAREPDHVCDVVRARALCEQRRLAVDHRVEQLARLVVAAVAGSGQVPAKAGAELAARTL